MNEKIEKWVCRASRSGELKTGKIGLTDNQEIELAGYEEKLGSGKKLTPRQEGLFNNLITKKASRELPKTCQTMLRSEFRQLKYNREFMFTNKYVQKGIQQEEESITLLSKHLNKPLFKNTERLTNDFFTGLCDITPKFVGKGIDVKSVWSLQTFPWKDDPIDPIYESQNQVYMDLHDCGEWMTISCLVNATDAMVHNEKMKYFYQMGQPDGEDEIYKDICRKIERNMIFDIDRFRRYYPGFDFDNEILDFDIPEKDRIVIFNSTRDKAFIEELKERVILGREYMKTLIDVT